MRISFTGTSKTFGSPPDHVVALAEISATIESGEFVSIVGPSGCGKSTLLRLAAGLLPASTGSVEIGDSVVTEAREDTGIVFQKPVLLPWRTVADNIALPADVLGRPRKETMRRVSELLDIVGLADFGSRYPGQLSGGMQQRVAICRALILRPKVLLMDEPFGALDAITREKMGVDLLEIWKEVGATVVFVTHSIPEAIFLSDRVWVMSPRPGRLVADLHVDFPRPRGLVLLSDSDFAHLAGEVRGLIEGGPGSGVPVGAHTATVHL